MRFGDACRTGMALAALVLAPAVGAQGAVRVVPAANALATAVPEVPMVAYTSVFEGYRGLTEQAPVAWLQANQVVEQVGGWRAYAREASADSASRRPALP